MGHGPTCDIQFVIEHRAVAGIGHERNQHDSTPPNKVLDLETPTLINQQRTLAQFDDIPVRSEPIPALSQQA